MRHACADLYAFPDTVVYTHSNPHADANRFTNTNADTHGCPNTYAFPRADRNTVSHTNGQVDAHDCRHSYTDSNPSACAYAHANRLPRPDGPLSHEFPRL